MTTVGPDLHERESRLCVVAPGVGSITAGALAATTDDITRFRSAHECEAYLGVVPGERSSGEKRRAGRITTAASRAWAAGIATRTARGPRPRRASAA